MQATGNHTQYPGNLYLTPLRKQIPFSLSSAENIQPAEYGI